MSHNTRQCYINICPLQNENPSYIKKREKESHGTNSFTEIRTGCSATSFMGRLDCIQHGIGGLLVIRQAVARDFGSYATPYDPRGVCCSGTTSS